MFTGIVQTKATVIKAQLENAVMRLVISVDNTYLEKLTHGASIAINGCCLTVVSFETQPHDVVGQVTFDVIDETLKLTNLGNLKAGDKVNFERSMTFGTELGGHIVSGHIHTLAKLVTVKHTDDNVMMRLQLEPSWLDYVLYKGFISVNGCSLTVGEVFDDGFALHLIPETLSITNLGDASEGDDFNIEVDQQTYAIVNTVERYMKRKNNR